MAKHQVQKAKALVVTTPGSDPEWKEFELSLGVFGMWELEGPDRSDGSLRTTHAFFSDFRNADAAWMSWFAIGQPGGPKGFKSWMMKSFHGFEFVSSDEESETDPKESLD